MINLHRKNEIRERIGMGEYLGKDIPKLGFGLMRLPRVEGTIDIEPVKEMVDLFMERGFTYFDTAFGYDGSELAIGEALVKRYPRDSYQLATKLPAWTAKSKEEAEQMFWTSLERTGVDYFDFYLHHNVGKNRIQAFDDYGIWDFLVKRKEEGLIRHLGLSMHDSAVVLERLLDEHPEIEFVQLQVNYADWDNDAVQSRKCYEVARKKGKPVVIMEPVKGGNLLKLPQESIDTLKALDPDASLASWAIRFAASLEGVVTVLSGMSNIQQVQDNTTYMADFKPLSEEELAAIVSVREQISKIPSVPCTSCEYCLPVCAQNVAIPGIFESLNMSLRYGKGPSAQFSYMWNTKGHGREPASSCIECGECEAVCTQQLPIIEDLKRAKELFEA
jgi:predicted aldo/keto reductase-like oxidoreductase